MSGMFRFRIKNIKKLLKEFRQKFETPFFRRLSTRLLFTLTVLSAIPLILVGLFMRSVTQESISEYIKSQNSIIARRAANEIKLFLNTPNQQLRILLETGDIIDMNPFTQKLILNKVFTEYGPMFDRIFTIDTLGIEVTTSDLTPHETSYADQEFYSHALLKGEDYFSEVKFNEAQEPYLVSSYPIRQFDRIVGVLAAEINLKSIWELVDEIKIGASGNAFVIDLSKQLIAHPDKNKVIDRERVIDIDLNLDKEPLTDNSRLFLSPEGVEMLGTFAYLQEYKWVVVIQQPVDEAFAVASRMLYQVFAFVALVIMLAILLSYLLEKRITSPITTLVKGVKRYAEGDLDFRITIEKYEEIAVLAEEFNAMASSLLENQRKLRRVERLAAMSKFATLVSHEIRNPLNSMNINMQILKREMENPSGDSEKKQKYFNIITSEINRMENLIKNFLMISRPPRFDFLPNNMHDILDEVVLMHSANAEQQNVDIRKEYYRRTVMVSVDRDQIKQVFHNIIINSLQAMPGGGRLTIKTGLKRMRTRLDQNVRSLRIEFKDTGVGIPKDKVKDIFEVYYTMKKTGTGLGLAIARQIVEGHFGTINVRSEENHGTLLVVNLPLKPGQSTFIESEPLTLEP
jgi:signal transduction histidine kinase